MPKTEWRNWLQTEPKPRRRAETKEEKQLRTQRERKMRFEIRRIAQRALEDLTLIMTRLRKVSEHPERDYARIFKDGTQYVNMVEACNHAYNSSFESRLRLYSKLYTTENVDMLRDALSRAGLGYQKREQLATPRARIKAAEELKRKEVEDGIPYFKELVASRFARQPTMVLVERNKELIAMLRQEQERKRKEEFSQ